MSKVNKIIPIFSLICIIFLIIYTIHLNKKINYQAAQISKLELYGTKLTDLEKHIKEYELKTDAVIMNNIELINSFQKEFPEDSFYYDYKNKIQSLLNNKINEIVPENPLHRGSWVITSINFISPTFIEVNYEDGHDVSSSLILVKITKKGFSFLNVK